MKSVLILFSTLMLAAMPSMSHAQVTLYPPLNIEGAAMECSVYLTWDKPELPGGGTPQGLLGYNVYKEGSLFAYVSGQDTTWFYEISPQPCPSDSHSYYVTAYYDLAYYGYPGQFGESSSTDTITVIIICDRPFPFIEDWDQASFAFLDWSFEPGQGNWLISSVSGNPPPAAIFTGTPAVLNYEIRMQSAYIMTNFTQGCMDVYLDFNLKLDNLVNSGTEKMVIETSVCQGPTDTVDVFENVTGFDWTHYRYTINAARGQILKIMFTATGENSANIQQWLIDNIVVDFKCRPPVNLDAINQGDTAAYFTWDPPECDMGTVPNWYHLSGYNIYMSDSLGNPPFTRCNSSPITGEWYMHYYAPGWDPSVVRFYLTDIQHDSATYIFLCESEPSDTVSAHFVGIGPKAYSTCNIYPNPNDGMFTVDLPLDAVSAVISDVKGSVVRDISNAADRAGNMRFDLRNEPRGVYLIKIRTVKGISVSKIIKL